MDIDVIGIDHVFITVSDVKISEDFYDRVMRVLGFRKNSFLNDGDCHIQYYNRHFGFVLRSAQPGTQRYHSLNPGLHHFCFRVSDPATIDDIAQEFRALRIDCSPPQFYPEYMRQIIMRCSSAILTGFVWK